MKIADVIKYYSTASDDMRECTKTIEFLRGHKLKNSAYENLAKLFLNYKKKNSRAEDRDFYNYLKDNNENHCYVFEDNLIADVDLFNPFIDKENTIISQKWHLLVSVYAFLDFINNKAEDKDKYKDLSIFKKRRIKFSDEEITGTVSNWRLIEKTGYSYDAMKLWMAEYAGVSNLETYVKTENKIGNQVKIPWDVVAEKISKSYFLLFKKNAATTSAKKILKLDREAFFVEVFEQASVDAFKMYYNIKPEYDSSEYDIYEISKKIKCIFGRAESPTPVGVFDITNKSMPKEAYVSEYHPKYDKVKFFGYLEIFEDYFIHSDMYEASVAELPENNECSISNNDCDTAGCIRVSQQDLSWLVDNIEIGTPVIL